MTVQIEPLDQRLGTLGLTNWSLATRTIDVEGLVLLYNRRYAPTLPAVLTMWSAVTPSSAAAATTLALLEEYVIFNLTGDSSGQLYTKTETGKGNKRWRKRRPRRNMSANMTVDLRYTYYNHHVLLYAKRYPLGRPEGRVGSAKQVVRRLHLPPQEPSTPVHRKTVALREKDETNSWSAENR